MTDMERKRAFTEFEIAEIKEELQRMRIERAGFISEIEELKAEIVQLKDEAENLRAAVAALPLGEAGIR